ncbi:MAG: hypothetical protein ACRCTQ_05470 [Brevinemataceae bacterium]
MDCLKRYIFLLVLLILPAVFYPQIIDNRDLPPELLRVKPPFERSDRQQLANRDDKIYIILDNADDIRIQEFDNTDTSEITMLGNVRIRFDGNFLKTEKLILTLKDSEIINVGAYGNIEFTLNGTKYLAESMNYQPDSERGVLYTVRSVLDIGLGGGSEELPWFFTAEKVTIQSPTRFVIDNAILTTSDKRFAHFSVKASKVWFLQGKLALAAGLQYITGQASFVWLPLFMQLEGGSGIRTSFGSEKRIGYYFINNYTLDSKIGTFDFGFDIYQLQGQYGKVVYKAPQVGMLKKLEFQFEIANDTRIVKNGDLFSDWVQPQFSNPDEYLRSTQVGWYYKIGATIATNNFSLDINLEDLNDPFFRSKYSYRSRFDSSESINLAELLNPTLNSWFGYQGDGQPTVNSINRSFALSAGNFSMSGKWELIRLTRPTETNQFLNSFYEYRIRSLILPDISYNFGTLDIAQYTYSNNATVTVEDSRGIKRKIPISRLDSYTNSLAQISNRTISRKVLVQKNGSLVTNFITNWNKTTVSNITTNNYNWFDMKLSSSVRTGFKAQQTFGTNSTSSTTDLEELSNTNWKPVSDVYRNENNGNLKLNLNFFESILLINNEVAINYTEQWSSFGACFTNSLRTSGLKVDYNIGATLNPKQTWDDDEWFRKSVDFNTAVQYSYPLYYLFRLQNDYVKESALSWKNKISLEFMQWQRITLLGLEASFDWNTRMRIPTAEQAAIIATDPADIYIDNLIFNRLTVDLKGKVFWFGIGANSTIDILQTETNNTPILGEGFTNRLIGGYPKLYVEFAPDSKYHYIPKFRYSYNLFEQTQHLTDPVTGQQIVLRADKSYDMEILWDLRLKNYQIPALYPFIYELSEFGLVFKYYQNFENIRSSYLSLDFVLAFKMTKYLSLKFSSKMLNNKIYLYFGQTFNGENILAPGESPKNFWTDLADGLKIWDQDALKRSSFKLQSFSVELIHDLETWDMRLIFNLGRRVDSIKQIAFWEPYIGLAFTMKGSSTPNIFPEFQRRFVPAEYQ